MAVTAESVLNDLENKKYSPIYFLCGEEAFYIDEISNYIEKNALSESDKSFNQVVMYGKDSSVMSILNNAKRYPMMSERQVVIVKEAQDIPAFEKEENWKQIESYIKNPLPSTILVFAYKSKKSDKKGIIKTLNDGTVFVETKKLYDYQIPDWINKYVASKGLKITPKATSLLAESVGANLSRISNEISKVILNIKAGETITDDIIQRFIGISKEYNVFELQKAVSTKDTVKIFKILKYFESNQKENPAIGVISSLMGHFCKIMMVHATPNKDEKSLATLLGLHPFFVKDYTLAARNYPMPKLVSCIHFLREADLCSKGIDSNLEEGQILKELLYKIIHV